MAGRTTRRIVGLCLLALASLAVFSQEAPSSERETPSPATNPLPPFDSGMVERTGVSLVLIDVVVVDDDGNPIPGLTKDDFEVQLSGRAHDIYSVDDLCPAGPVAGTTGDLAESSQPAAATVAARAAASVAPAAREVFTTAPAREARRFVLYFDFSQLRPDGRVRATDEARRWIRETMRDDDLVQIVAYAPRPGLRELTPFTSDEARLLAVVDEAYADMDFVDPWPGLLPVRIAHCCLPCTRKPQCCRSCCPDPRGDCFHSAWDEYRHGKRSLEALSLFVRSLEDVPGHKSLILFHQNATQFPAIWYPSTNPEVGDHAELLEEIGADATRSRTVLYPAYTGDYLEPDAMLSDFAVNLGANLADYTGGRYNRGAVDLPEMTDAAGREASCIYRIGLLERGRIPSRVLRAKVWLRDRPLSFRFRVQFLDDTDLWWRRAQAVLFTPERYTDVGVGAAIVPVALDETGWSVAVRVSLALGSLMVFPQPQGEQGEWEVGAMLDLEASTKNWEMLGRSKLLREGDAESEAFVLHERVFTGMTPGPYRLRAFVRDRSANLFGGAEASLELPKPGEGGIVGPFVMLARRPYVRSTLPLLRQERSDSTRDSNVRIGSVPAVATPLDGGGRLEMLSWICPPGGSGPPENLSRWVARGDEPLFRMEQPELEPVGTCYELRDSIDTSGLQPGAHAYNVRWSRRGEDEALEASASFEIAVKHSASGGDGSGSIDRAAAR